MLKKASFLEREVNNRHNFSTEIFFHCLAVANIAKQIGLAVGLTSLEVENLFYLALMHDIGKAQIPQNILYKPTKLSFKEWSIMKRHSIYSEKMYIDMATKVDKVVIKNGKILRHHHENIDGSGYPDGLKGEQIPFESRIIAIADCFEAITSPRVYRPFSVDDPIKLMDEEIGHKFDEYIYKNSRDILKKITFNPYL